MSQAKKPKKVSFQVFPRTGGPQPTSLDPEEINYFFKRNYAKVWAMCRGYLPTFKCYEDGKIVFDLVTDPRFTGNPLMLCMLIAQEYKSKVDLLNDADSFLAFQYIAEDIIGFVADASDTALLQELSERRKKAVEGLNEEPDCLHAGLIPKLKNKENGLI